MYNNYTVVVWLSFGCTKNMRMFVNLWFTKSWFNICPWNEENEKWNTNLYNINIFFGMLFLGANPSVPLLIRSDIERVT